MSPAANRARYGYPSRKKIFLVLAGFVLLLVLVVLSLDLFRLVFHVDTVTAPQLIAESASGLLTVGARGPFTLEFKEAMLRSSVENGISFAPPLDGYFTWEGTDGRSVSFWPARPLQPGQRYRMRLSAGVRSEGGRELLKAQSWQVEVRPANLLYLSPSQSPELWVNSGAGQKSKQLTDTGGRIIDYAVSFDGNHIVYSVKNAQQGVDLWEMDRAGASAHLLLPCGTDWCFGPAYKPDGTRISYSRRKVSGLPGRQPEIPRIWLLERATQTTSELITDAQVGGAWAVWSPDGRYLAFYDEISGGLRVYNAETQADFLLPAAQGTGIEWAPDSASLLYLQSGINGDAPYTSVYQVDVRTQKTNRVFGEDAAEYSVPAWSSDGAWAVVGQRLAGGSLTRQLWLINTANGWKDKERQAVTDDALFNHGGYQWEPGGSRLVYQRLAFGSSNSRPQVVIWDRKDGQTSLLAEDAFQPVWLP